MEIDVFGDVHGHAPALRALLKELGYEYRDGCYRHPDPNRTALFLGDIIDRGPEQLASIDIVRRMVDSGRALCLMGNHEHSGLGWMLPDPERPGEFLRPHTPNNLKQHRVFLEQIGTDKAVRDDLVNWFLSLPLYHESGALRAVHACWQPQVVDQLREMSNGTARLSNERVLIEGYRSKHPTRTLVDITIRGREVDLPHGASFIDGDGVERDKSRVRWWADTRPSTLRELIVDEVGVDGPADPGALYFSADDADPRPIFFGHYWMAGEPRIISRKATCIDFSVAAGGSLCAYTFRGETELVPESLTWVDAKTLLPSRGSQVDDLVEARKIAV